jgi:hypothetical protein
MINVGCRRARSNPGGLSVLRAAAPATGMMRTAPEMTMKRAPGEVASV